MEYSKEDLIEAKSKILGYEENIGTEESKKIWEKNAQFWDNAMGDESNEFHREVVRPKVTELLSPNPEDYIFDIACGNGNYSSYLAQRGASVVAFDYSKKMIELAKRRQSQYAKQIEFCVADAVDQCLDFGIIHNLTYLVAVGFLLNFMFNIQLEGVLTVLIFGIARSFLVVFIRPRVISVKHTFAGHTATVHLEDIRHRFVASHLEKTIQFFIGCFLCFIGAKHELKFSVKRFEGEGVGGCCDAVGNKTQSVRHDI